MLFIIHQKRFSFLKKTFISFFTNGANRPGVNRPVRKMVLEGIVPGGTGFGANRPVIHPKGGTALKSENASVMQWKSYPTGETEIKAPYKYGLGCWRNIKLTSSSPFLYFLSYGLSVCRQCAE